MKKKTINLYTIKELSKEAQEKAHRHYTSDNDYPFLEEAMKEYLFDLLTENSIRVEEVDRDNVRVFYSLACCQGDGAMFEGRFWWKGWTIKVKHRGRYYHYNSKDIEMYKISDDEELTELAPTEAEEKEFNDLYVSIAKKLEKYGYDWIEQEDSMEHFVEECELNGWTFREDGTMENE